ncbi:MAG: hypothetical protein WKF78_14345 [Candidatus Limnocylindrales bacterium]
MPEVKSRTYANPRRLPRRNHYQEGPGFLFVASQGGRPPDGSRASSAQAAALRRRRRPRSGAGPTAKRSPRSAPSSAAVGRACSAGGPATKQGGLEALARPVRGSGGRSELPAALERLILTVRLLTYWNSRRIAAEFRRRGVWPLGHGQVDRLLGPPRHATGRATSGRPARATSEPAVNELWHIDLKGPFYLLGATRPGTDLSLRRASSTTTAGSCSASGPCRPRRRSGSSPCSRRRSSCAASRTS